jgi:two-component system OmpR family response regulator
MDTAYRILIVDDDSSLCVLLVEYLSRHGLQPTGVGTIAEARAAMQTEAFDLVMLDLGLPDGDGLQAARAWRDEGAMPIICITGRDEEADRVMGLEGGADDYITKPFSLREVLARVRAVLRRTAASSPATPVARGKMPRAYRFAGWTLNLNTRRLTHVEHDEVSLTNAEFNLMAALLNAGQRVISRQQMIEFTRAFDDVYDRAIDVQILRLRRKIEVDPAAPRLLCTKRGAGYYLDATIETVW